MIQSPTTTATTSYVVTNAAGRVVYTSNAPDLCRAFVAANQDRLGPLSAEKVVTITREVRTPLGAPVLVGSTAARTRRLRCS